MPAGIPIVMKPLAGLAAWPDAASHPSVVLMFFATAPGEAARAMQAVEAAFTFALVAKPITVIADTASASPSRPAPIPRRRRTRVITNASLPQLLNF